ncbi:MAG: tetratricopeptide repeat protein, partial [Gemmatimonadales bacterium]
DMADALQEAAYSGGEDALAFQEEALRIRRALYGETHTSVAASLNDLAMVYDEHEPGTGDSLMQKAIEIDRELLGPAHATTLTLLNNYAWMKAERGDYEGAVPVFREVLAERERAYPEERWLLAYPLHGLGVTLMNAGRHAEAEQALRQTVEVLLTDEDSVSRLASLIAISRISLSKCLLAQGRFDESESMAGVALEGLTARPDLKSNADAARVQLEAIARAREETSTR